MEEMSRPFVRLWTWVEQEGGYPGQVFLVTAIVMAIVAFCTWLGNRR
jgi:hypothetical protein